MDLKSINIIIIRATIFIVTLVLTQSCESNYKYIFLSKDNNIVTRIEYSSFVYGNHTYFIPGLYEKESPPPLYIKPNYSGFTSGFELIVHWRNDTCVFYYYTGDFTVQDPQNSFIVQKIPVEKFLKMKKDTTGSYLYQIEKEII